MRGLPPQELDTYIGTIVLGPSLGAESGTLEYVVAIDLNASEPLTAPRPLPSPVVIRSQLGDIAGTGWAAGLRDKNLYPGLAPARHDPDNVLLLYEVHWMSTHSLGSAITEGYHVYWDQEGEMLSVDYRRRRWRNG